MQELFRSDEESEGEDITFHGQKASALVRLFKQTILNWQNFVMSLIFNCLVEVVVVFYITHL